MPIEEMVRRWLQDWRERGVELGSGASAEDLAEAERLFRDKGALGVPPDLRALWSTANGAGVGTVVVWGIRREEDTPVGFREGIVEANSELTGRIPAEYVYIGRAADEYLGYHLPSGRVDFLDFLAVPRDGFPDVQTMVQVATTDA